METKNMLNGIVSLTVVVICFAAFMMPVLNDAMETAGAEKTFSNTVRGVYTYNIWEGENVTFAYTVDSTANTYTVDGETVTLTSQQNILIASNFFSMRTGGQATNPGINYQYQGLTAGAEATLTYVIEDGAYTLTIGDTVLTGDVEWLIYAVADGDTGTSNLGQLTAPTSAFYTSNANNVVALGNIYTTGENDTYYAYYGGDLTVNEAYEDSSSVTVAQTLVSGYTNVYSTTVSVTIDDETFTPYFILAPITATGNEASGAAYSLYAAIPVIVIAGIVVAAVGMVVTRRD